MSEHLKLPLKLSSAEGCLIFTNATGDYVATVQLKQTGGGFIAERMKRKRKAYAEYILLACNSHKALLEICKKIKEAGDSNVEDCHKFLSALDDCWDELEAAIKAGKEDLTNE